jgi:hypothetical protein
MRILKKKIQNDGLFKRLKLKKNYEKPSEYKRRKQRESLEIGSGLPLQRANIDRKISSNPIFNPAELIFCGFFYENETKCRLR